VSLEARARLAEVSAVAGDVDAATAALGEARDMERSLGESALTALLDRIAVTIAVAAGDRAGAIAQLPPAGETTRRLSAKYDLLVLLTIAADLGEEDGTRERTELADELGVVGLPVLPAR